MLQHETLKSAAVSAPAPAGHRADRARARAVLAELPAPSAAARRLNEILTSIPVDLNELGNVVRMNGALAEQILKLANSSLFNLPRPASSIEQAVIAIGADNLRTLTLTCGLVEWIASQLPAEDSGIFWQHSFLTALFSQRIAQWVLGNAAEQAYLAGFLHDVGRIPLVLQARAEAAPSLTPAERWIESVEVEEKTFGISHCEAGRYIGLHWGLPLPVVEVLVFHHNPASAPPDAPLVRIVSAADEFASWRQREGQGAETSSATRLASERILDACLPGLSLKVRTGLIDTLQSESAFSGQLSAFSSPVLDAAGPKAERS